MKIMVNNMLTYESDVPIKVGDIVELPPNIYHPENWLAKVTSLDSTYQGPLKKIIRNHGKNKNAKTLLQEKRIELAKQEEEKRAATFIIDHAKDFFSRMELKETDDV